MEITSRSPGRPRSERARRAILDAAYAQLAAHGFADLSIEGIAAAAGVSKQTIYRWWPSKAEVVLEAMLDRAGVLVPPVDTGVLEDDLRAFLETTFAAAEPTLIRVLTGLMAQATLDPAFGRVFNERFLAARRDILRELLERGVARGELPAGHDLDVRVDAVYGLLWYRLLVGHRPLDSATARELTELVLGGQDASTRPVSKRV
ncbi:MAG: TetR/AcrR family transcriptional regulator [Mycobacteriales bacterium]